MAERMRAILLGGPVHGATYETRVNTGELNIPTYNRDNIAWGNFVQDHYFRHKDTNYFIHENASSDIKTVGFVLIVDNRINLYSTAADILIGWELDSFLRSQGLEDTPHTLVWTKQVNMPSRGEIHEGCSELRPVPAYPRRWDERSDPRLKTKRIKAILDIFFYRGSGD